MEWDQSFYDWYATKVSNDPIPIDKFSELKRKVDEIAAKQHAIYRSVQSCLKLMQFIVRQDGMMRLRGSDSKSDESDLSEEFYDSTKDKEGNDEENGNVSKIEGDDDSESQRKKRKTE